MILMDLPIYKYTMLSLTINKLKLKILRAEF
jgi:hypothetical protein